MSRVERVDMLLRQIEHETKVAFDEHSELLSQNARLKAENAKLRELVRDVYALHWSGLDCTECPWIGECDTDGGCPWLGIMHDHMRELGIEVEQ